MRVSLAIFVAALLLAPRAGLAQTATRSSDHSRAWVDVNLLGIANSSAPATTFEFPFVTFGESASIGAMYPKPARVRQFGLVDIGGGVMFGRFVGAGASWGRTAYEDVVGLTATIPHPVFFNAHATGTGATDVALKRQEDAVNIFVAVVPYESDRVQLRVYGGPSFFRYKADMVQDIAYSQTYSFTTTLNTITITDFVQTDDVQGTNKGIGFNVGGDFAYFFTKIFGVGGGVRISRGTVTVGEEPMSEVSQEIKVGGTLIFAGLRLRFGR